MKKKIQWGPVCHHYKNMFAAIALLIVFALIIAGAQHIQLLVIATVNAKFWPTLLGIGGCLLSLYLIVQEYKTGRKAMESEMKEVPEACGRREKWYHGNSLRSLQTFLLIFFYTLFFQALGWILATVLYLFFQISVLTEKERRRPVRTALMSIVFTVLVYVIFRYLFVLMLPSGTIWNAI